MSDAKLKFLPGCQTTGMSILPHTDVDKALSLALSLDIPFWPQLPRVSFYEDMYAQASYDFPGVIIDPAEEKIRFNTRKFEEELSEYSVRMANPEAFALSDGYDTVYQRFLNQDLRGYSAIHGQVTGPVNLGFRINDEDSKPIIYNEQVRVLLFDFIRRKFIAQLKQLRGKNRNAFVWLDEPGLIWVFSGITGYNDIHAKQDYQDFLQGWDGLKALHLCSNVNLAYLLGLGINFLSFDAYQMQIMPRGYTRDVVEFLRKGGIISWGIVPTEPAVLSQETPETIATLILGYWEIISQNSDLPMEQIARQALLAPAKCCVKSMEFSDRDKKACETGSTNLITEEQSVEQAYTYLKTLSGMLRDKFGL